MIQFVKSFQTTDGQTWPTIELAQAKELELLFQEALVALPPDLLMSSTALLVKQKEKVIDILTTTAKSKPKARAINGGKKKRAAKLPATLDGEGEKLERERPKP